LLPAYTLREKIFFSAILGMLLLLGFRFGERKSWREPLNWDPEGYYYYLPGLFIYAFEDMPVQTQELFTTNETTGKTTTKYTLGTALLQLPFFLVCHAAQHTLNRDTSGYSVPYRQTILLSSVFYCFVGLLLLYAVLRARASIPISMLVILTVLSGSSLFMYTAYRPGWSHPYAFFLVSLLVYLTERYARADRNAVPPPFAGKKAFQQALLLGLVMGLITLVRIPNILFILFPMFYHVGTWADLRNRVLTLRKNTYAIAAGVLVFGLLIALQFLYWFYTTGHFDMAAYPGETFKYWNNPKLIPVLFSIQNGFLAYAPAFFLVIPYFFLREPASGMRTKWALTIVLLLFYYSIASWWAWWFGGAFGHRAFIDVLPFLAIGLAVFLQGLIGRNKYLYLGSLAYLMLCTLLTFGLTNVYDPPWDGPEWNRAEYWERMARAVRFYL